MIKNLFTLNELLVTTLSHEFKNGEVGFTGLATGKNAALFATAIPLVAMELARRTHAPDLTILLAGWIQNPELSKLIRIPDAEFDETLRDIPCESQMLSYPGQYSLRRGNISFGFGSGAQIDKHGNINSVCIGHHNKPKVRLVGPILLPEHFSMFGREYIMVPHHEKRVLVNKVDYIAGVGFQGGLKERKSLGLNNCGPALVVTPKCIFDFDKNTGIMKLRSIHPGISKQDIINSTGFDLGDISNVINTPPPLPSELRIIREKIDPNKVLLK